ncbi:MAG: BREX-1 system adenine-specific DNA-methyltransferase PglX [Phycisphaerales bacterium]|nr:BREX-1 system adenine-specific DNA-methyltransferase PglX [Phycisphaerales bacterium]
MAQRRNTPPQPEQALLPFAPVRNSEFLSNHWLDNRLPLEPEWSEIRQEAQDSLTELLELWNRQKELVEQYGDEQGLEEAFIQPVLRSLGWTLKYQTFLQGREPDYALFHDEQSHASAIRAGRTSPDFWNYPTLVADAKAWHVTLDRPTGRGSRREYPPEQIEWYLDRSRLAYGILTNGKLWRLIPREREPGKPRFQTYLEADLPRILDAWQGRQMTINGHELDDFLRFFLFFSPHGFRPAENRTALIDRAITGSSEYRIAVGEDLKERVFEALRLCIQGFLSHRSNRLRPEHLEACRQHSFILLYRLLFVMYAEDRALLPYRVNRTYTNNRSLARHRDEIAARLDRIRGGREDDYSTTSTNIWQDLSDLFDLIDRGHRRYGVPAYNGGLFDTEENAFLTTKAIPDWYLARVIDQLGRAPENGGDPPELFRVDYRDLSIQHLGSVYEGLLELHPRFAAENMVVVRKRGHDKRAELVQPETRAVPSGFELTDIRYEAESVYLETDKGERRSFGSYYTPDHIVECIIENTLGPLCREVDSRLNAELAEVQTEIETADTANRRQLEARLDQLHAAFDDRILQLRVLDPAMGSGHFLVRACQFLAEEIATNPHTGDPEADQLHDDESTLNYWKRRVVESCLYGVDINPLAVELSKLALWLETVSSNLPLSFLDHHLRPGNSLVGGWIQELGVLPNTPPLLRNAFRLQVETALPRLLQPLAEIRQLPSHDARDIKKKQSLYRRRFRPICTVFESVADLWCASFFGDDGSIDATKYDEALQALARPRSHRELMERTWCKTALKSVRDPEVSAFHWELEFPDAFFDVTGRRRHENPGFDAVIGNPPYDVLAERELGRDLSALKAFIAHEDVYQPSRKGKNNLYKLFICKSLALLKLGGRFGFIVPMPLLGDEQAVGVRKAVIEHGAFTVIHAFPQKDNYKKRVFRDAKLSTVVFAMLRTDDEGLKNRPFISHLHPAQFIEEDSPRLQLDTASIPLYDPANFTIVSCSQEDWDLAIRIVQTRRMQRLSAVCESFQGEVNETNERKRGALSDNARHGPLVLRGSNVSLYIVREASQGTALHLRRRVFLEGKSRTSKAYDTAHRRVGFQRSSPQNNFRRIIATLIEPDNYCFDTVSYVPEPKSAIPLPALVALLNSKLLDWYFRLGSTNSKVNEYQFNILPCPVFKDGYDTDDEAARNQALTLLERQDYEGVLDVLRPGLERSPFTPAACDVLVELSNRIAAAEENRGDIARADRSKLGDEAQPYQDLIDRILYSMAGLGDHESRGLEERLQAML